MPARKWMGPGGVGDMMASSVLVSEDFLTWLFLIPNVMDGLRWEAAFSVASL